MTLDEFDAIYLLSLNGVIEDWERYENRLNVHMATVRAYSSLMVDPQLEKFEILRGQYRGIIQAAIAASDSESRTLLSKLTWLCGPNNLP